MGYNNSPNRGAKFLQNINSRFSEVIVASQIKGLFKDECFGEGATSVNMYMESTKNWFDAIPGKAEAKPRYKDDAPASMFWDDKPKRILLSKYKEHLGQDFFAIGMNYGVLIGKSIVARLGGHDIVSRILAVQGLQGVWSVVQTIPQNDRDFLKNEIDLLSHAIAMETRTSV